jgi:diguanylate cyclase (GGDEF)-like protein
VDRLTAAAFLIAVVAVLATAFAHGRAARARREVLALRRDLVAEQHAARHDALTGLLNRRGFYHYGVATVTEPAGGTAAVLLLDLDDFKLVNDRFGHAAGDEVLGVVARRFARCAESDIAARLGGDEFASLLVVPPGDLAWVDRVTRRLTEAMAAPIRVGDDEVTVSASVGVAPVRGPEMAHFADAMRTADREMYRAKAASRGLPPCDEPTRLRLVHTGQHSHTGPLNPAPTHGAASHHVARSARSPQQETVPGHRGPASAGNHSHRR